jgi:predicted aminopeptidase
MTIFLRWFRFSASCVFFVFSVFCAYHHRTTRYIVSQAAGQAKILLQATGPEEYLRSKPRTETEKANLSLANEVRRYSIDSLGYLPTNNFTRVYDQGGKPILWVVTACGRFDLEPYTWKFPVVGKVSYKGFFDHSKACAEYIRLYHEGYDAAIRSVSAWSTLGWFNDPLLSNALKRKRGSFCDLLFHELFHATFYKPGDVDLNENLANFIAFKATQQFLRGSDSLETYLRQSSDEKIYRRFLLRKYQELENGYRELTEAEKPLFKKGLLKAIADSVSSLDLHFPEAYRQRSRDIARFQNAFFVDLKQYDSLQDSLEKAFNKNYGGRLQNMVRDLRSK